MSTTPESSFHAVDATPSAPVVTVAGETLPCTAVNATVAPLTGCAPFATRTLSGACSLGKSWSPGRVSCPSPPTYSSVVRSCTVAVNRTIWFGITAGAASSRCAVHTCGPGGTGFAAVAGASSFQVKAAMPSASVVTSTAAPPSGVKRTRAPGTGTSPFATLTSRGLGRAGKPAS